MRFEELETRVHRAFATLLRSDLFLLQVEVGEQCLCGRLAMYLQELFPDHSVDIEYNRRSVDPKRFDLAKYQAFGDGLFIPDIVIHHRGNDAANLLAIELKRTSNRESRDNDRAKLEGLVEDLGYRYAVSAEIPDGDDAGQLPRLDWLTRDRHLGLGTQ